MTRKVIDLAKADDDFLRQAMGETSYQHLVARSARLDGPAAGRFLTDTADEYFLASALGVAIHKVYRNANEETVGFTTTDLNAKALGRLMNAEIVDRGVSYCFDKLDATIVEIWETYAGHDLDECRPSTNAYIAVMYRKV